MATKLFQLGSKFCAVGFGACCFYLTRGVKVCLCIHEDESHSSRNPDFTKEDNLKIDKCIDGGPENYPFLRPLKNFLVANGDEMRKKNMEKSWNFGYALIKQGMQELGLPAEVTPKSVSIVFTCLIEVSERMGFLWEKPEHDWLNTCAFHPIVDWDKVKKKLDAADAKRRARQEKEEAKKQKKQTKKSGSADDLQLTETKSSSKKKKTNKNSGDTDDDEKGSKSSEEKKAAGASGRRPSLNGKDKVLTKQGSAKTPRGDKSATATTTATPTPAEAKKAPSLSRPKSARSTWSSADIKKAQEEKSGATPSKPAQRGAASAAVDPQTPRGKASPSAAAPTTPKSARSTVSGSSSTTSLNKSKDDMGSSTTPRARGKSTGAAPSGRSKSTLTLDD